MPTPVFRLEEILQNPDAFPWDYELHLHGRFPWEADTPAVVMAADGDDPYYTEDDTFAADNDFVYAMDIGTLQELIEDAEEQNPHAVLRHLLQAFNFYYQHDEYIRF